MISHRYCHCTFCLSTSSTSHLILTPIHHIMSDNILSFPILTSSNWGQWADNMEAYLSTKDGNTSIAPLHHLYWLILLPLQMKRRSWLPGKGRLLKPVERSGLP